MRLNPLLLSLSMAGIVTACGGGGGGTFVPPEPAPVEPETVTYIKAADADQNDGFGTAVAVSAAGARLAVGAPAAASILDLVSGKVYVYDWNGTAWSLRDTAFSGEVIQGGGGIPGRFELFGDAVALSGDGVTLAVGGPWAAGQSFVGNAHVFVYNDATHAFDLQRSLQDTALQTEDRLGSAVALSADGDILAAGAPGFDDGVADVGAVRMFTRDGTGAWSTSDRLLASVAEQDAGFGAAVAINGDGTLVAVGAPGVDGEFGATPDAGAVYLFHWNGANWVERTVRYGSDAGAAFGSSVALVATAANAATLAVGAPDAGNGAVHLYTWDGAVWSAGATILTAGNGEPGDRFGSAVALGTADAALLAVGADSEDSAATGFDGNGSDNSASDAGAVYLFEKGAAGWTESRYLKASNTGAGDRLGAAVALSGFGETLAAGAWGEDGSAVDDGDIPTTLESGAVYIY